ncbi:MAG: AbrB/MazE/SpoVT family DNA-binding domain-containing protein [Bryobacterales bacterium]|nr:AbrB/MazE/SpoVT family DNA-binding domain-containing protein [Bryobacterales bacterium]
MSSEGHVAIPKDVREGLNLKPGTEVAIDAEGETLSLIATGRRSQRTAAARACADG